MAKFGFIIKTVWLGKMVSNPTLNKNCNLVRFCVLFLYYITCRQNSMIKLFYCFTVFTLAVHSWKLNFCKPDMPHRRLSVLSKQLKWKRSIVFRNSFNSLANFIFRIISCWGWNIKNLELNLFIQGYFTLLKCPQLWYLETYVRKKGSWVVKLSHQHDGVAPLAQISILNFICSFWLMKLQVLCP